MGKKSVESGVGRAGSCACAGVVVLIQGSGKKEWYDISEFFSSFISFALFGFIFFQI